MTEFEKEFQYALMKFRKVITPDDLAAAKRFKRDFIDKYIVKISQTDKTFVDMQNQLMEAEIVATKKISSAYYFNK